MPPFWPPPPNGWAPSPPVLPDPSKAHRQAVRDGLRSLERSEPSKNPGESDAWPSDEAAARALKAEASATAAQLGHKLVDWLHRGGAWYSRCNECRAGIVVTPRSFRVAPIRGEAGQFRCRP